MARHNRRSRRNAKTQRPALDLSFVDAATDAAEALSALGCAQGVPPFVVRAVANAYGAAGGAVLEGYAAASGRPVTLRANRLKATPQDVAAALEAAGIAYRRVSWFEDAFVLENVGERDVWGLDIYRGGGIYLQSLSSMLPPIALGPRAGADILDMCAAPGGKTMQIASMTQGEAHLSACELSSPRADKLEHNLAKFGARNVVLMRTDARELDEFFGFDQILLDAPCTGTGTLVAGDERAEGRITPHLLGKVVSSQRALLDRGLKVLKPGGTLVYSTCSILPVENEDAVADALARHKDCRLVPILTEPPVDRGDDEGEAEAPKPILIAGAQGGDYPIPQLTSRIEGTLLVPPTREFEGFFVAAIVKRG